MDANGIESSISKTVETTYKNIIDELGPSIKHLVVAGRTYLKSMHGMMTSSRNYIDALHKVATLADKCTLGGSSDLASALHHVVEIDKEMQSQISNIMKSLEFDFLEPMEITADKDTKLIGKELKRFQQLHRGRRDDFEKSISTLKKSRRKKTINTDKQLAHIQVMENAKSRLDQFCEESLKEAVIQERVVYGTVLERQCALKKQILMCHVKGCEQLESSLPHWEALAETRYTLPNNCYPMPMSVDKKFLYGAADGSYQAGSPVDSGETGGQSGQSSVVSSTSSGAMESLDSSGIYARPLMRAKSEYNLSNEEAPPYIGGSGTLSNRYSRAVEYNGDMDRSYVRALYPYKASGDYQLTMAEGDIIEYTGQENSSGWQFGDNLRNKRSGWFPLSYTRPITIGAGPQVITKNDASAQSNAGIRPHYKQMETSDYGTLKASPRRVVPVSTPIVGDFQRSLSPSQKIISSRSPRRHTLQPNFADDNFEESRERYSTSMSNAPLQSMHL